MLYSSHLGNMLSRLTGRIVCLPLPIFLRTWVLTRFSTLFGVSIQEAEKPLTQYASISAFFARALKPEFRPIAHESVVCPVDGKVQEYGSVLGSKLIQAKGVFYTLEDLIPTLEAAHFKEGAFITYYLAPKDCHRIFSPVEGVIEGVCHVPGKLYPVREPHISGTPGIYTKNERIITILSTPKGRVAVVKVGAFNVGTISVPFDPDIRSNTGKRVLQEKRYPMPIPIKKGEWLGTFHLGSTVILVFEKDMLLPKWDYGAVQYGQAIGEFR